MNRFNLKAFGLFVFLAFFQLESLAQCPDVQIIAGSLERFNDSGTSSTDSYQLRPGLGRILVVGVGGDDPSGASNVNGVTYDGIPLIAATGLAEDIDASGRSTYTQLFYLPEANLIGLTDGTGYNVIITNTNQVAQFVINVLMLENVDQTALVIDDDDAVLANGPTLNLTASATTDFIVVLSADGNSSAGINYTGITSEMLNEDAGSYRNALAVNDMPIVGVNTVISDGGSNLRSTAVGFVVSKDVNCPLLPVELMSFDAQLLEDYVQLEWMTASELQNNYFEIQRSHNLIEWEAIGKVTGKGTTSELSSYMFNDHEVAFGYNYYRLKQVDFNGEYEFSSIKPVLLEKAKVASELVLYPNPSNGNYFTLSLKENRNIEYISVLDVTGKVVYEQSSEKNNTVTVNCEQKLASNTYFVKVIGSNGKAYVEKLVVNN